MDDVYYTQGGGSRGRRLVRRERRRLRGGDEEGQIYSEVSGKIYRLTVLIFKDVACMGCAYGDFTHSEEMKEGQPAHWSLN